ncbi:hypothetical protein FNF29_00103 [Cafeteria roenbergensis]|uniref:Uncharacterized protein n=1 Tax=Cafeteria roenbergensis TaxID=33653 RepID=A0A5A8CYT6_CAFRO|nr:hypothetical protein FNF29_00103 [Cafeteria roenbergensis]|eukprot:KAA0157527.1 hypothetical protein FNF29_00103 [Cafeteria roenbergensis]
MDEMVRHSTSAAQLLDEIDTTDSRLLTVPRLAAVFGRLSGFVRSSELQQQSLSPAERVMPSHVDAWGRTSLPDGKMMALRAGSLAASAYGRAELASESRYAELCELLTQRLRAANKGAAGDGDLGDQPDLQAAVSDSAAAKRSEPRWFEQHADAASAQSMGPTDADGVATPAKLSVSDLATLLASVSPSAHGAHLPALSALCGAIEARADSLSLKQVAAVSIAAQSATAVTPSLVQALAARASDLAGTGAPGAAGGGGGSGEVGGAGGPDGGSAAEDSAASRISALLGRSPSTTVIATVLGGVGRLGALGERLRHAAASGGTSSSGGSGPVFLRGVVGVAPAARGGQAGSEAVLSAQDADAGTAAEQAAAALAVPLVELIREARGRSAVSKQVGERGPAAAAQEAAAEFGVVCASLRQLGDALRSGLRDSAKSGARADAAAPAALGAGERRAAVLAGQCAQLVRATSGSFIGAVEAAREASEDHGADQERLDGTQDGGTIGSGWLAHVPGAFRALSAAMASVGVPLDAGRTSMPDAIRAEAIATASAVQLAIADLASATAVAAALVAARVPAAADSAPAASHQAQRWDELSAGEWMVSSLGAIEVAAPALAEAVETAQVLRAGLAAPVAAQPSGSSDGSQDGISAQVDTQSMRASLSLAMSEQALLRGLATLPVFEQLSDGQATLVAATLARRALEVTRKSADGLGLGSALSSFQAEAMTDAWDTVGRVMERRLERAGADVVRGRWEDSLRVGAHGLAVLTSAARAAEAIGQASSAAQQGAWTEEQFAAAGALQHASNGTAACVERLSTAIAGIISVSGDRGHSVAAHLLLNPTVVGKSELASVALPHHFFSAVADSLWGSVANSRSAADTARLAIAASAGSRSDCNSALMLVARAADLAMTPWEEVQRFQSETASMRAAAAHAELRSPTAAALCKAVTAAANALRFMASDIYGDNVSGHATAWSGLGTAVRSVQLASEDPLVSQAARATAASAAVFALERAIASAARATSETAPFELSPKAATSRGKARFAVLPLASADGLALSILAAMNLARAHLNSDLGLRAARSAAMLSGMLQRAADETEAATIQAPPSGSLLVCEDGSTLRDLRRCMLQH